MAGSDTDEVITTPQLNPKPDISQLGVEVGVEYNLPFSTPYQPMKDGTGKTPDEELYELFNPMSDYEGPSIRQLVAMRRVDGQAQALYRLLTLPIRAAIDSATFVGGEGDTGEAEFITNMFRTPPENGGMEVTFHKFMAELLQSLFDGFAAFEKVYWMPETGPLKGKWTLQKMAHRPAESIAFVANKTGSWRGFRQRATGTNGRTVDAFIARENAFYYAANEEQRKFYGISFFQSAFYHYDKKVKLYYTAHLAAQRAAVGTRVGTVPPNASMGAKREFAAALSNLAVAQYMMVPEGFKVELLKEAGTFDFLSLINHHNASMSKSMLAGFLDAATGAGNSDAPIVNFATPGDDMFVLMLSSVMDDIAAQINHYLIPQFIDWNFNTGNYPTFTWGKLTEDQKAAVANMFNKLATAGQQSNVTPEFMRALEENVSEEIGLDVDYEEVAKREAAEKEQAAAQQAALGGGGAPAPAGGTPPTLGGGTPPSPTDPSQDQNPAINQFEQQAVKLSQEREDGYRSLMGLANDLLEEAAKL